MEREMERDRWREIDRQTKRWRETDGERDGERDRWIERERLSGKFWRQGSHFPHYTSLQRGRVCGGEARRSGRVSGKIYIFPQSLSSRKEPTSSGKMLNVILKFQLGPQVDPFASKAIF